MALIFDLETNGLLDDVTTIHCMVIKDTRDGEVRIYVGSDVADGVSRLCDATLSGEDIVGHNVIKYDIPVIQKLFPGISFNPINVRDTIVCTRLIWSNIKDHDAKLIQEGRLPGKLFGSHSLAAWGHRLGNYKGDYDGGWETFSQEMLDYNIQDVEVTDTLYAKILSKEYAPLALELEHDIAWLMAKQERNGFHFDTAKAAILYAKLVQRRGELERELKDYFGSWVVQLPDFIPARDNKTKGYLKGVPVKKSKTIEFNPSSRDHIADRLINLYGWKPVDFTDGGKPMVDEVVLASLDYPPCKLLTEYLLIQKRAGQLSEGAQAWMKSEKKGRIHGSVNPNGAVTGRATHSYPNVAQVPSGGSAYGPECRELFTAPPGWKLVGADASGLELRCLAHFMARYDGGKYGEVLLNGDIHSVNQEAAGLPTRANAKTFIYGYLYGAGDAKIGLIVGKDAAEGKRLKAQFLKKTPALKKLRDAVQEAAKRGYLVGLDGRHLHIRSAHAALNTLLQSAGALVCKKWLLILDQNLHDAGLKHGWDGDYAFCAWVHDEVQIACRNQEVAEKVAEMAVDAVRLAGEYFEFRCPTAGEAKIGNNWSETH